LTLLCAHIFALVERYGLDSKYWLASFRIVWDEIKEASSYLQEDIDQGAFYGYPQSQDQRLAKLRWIINPLNL
jgi:hypothetical protein